MRRYKSFASRSLAGLVLSGLAAGGCDPQAAGPVDEYKVAEAVVGGGVKLEMSAFPDGSFLVSQSGSRGVTPMRLDETLIKQRDPVALWRQLAPGQAVPGALQDAATRAARLNAVRPERAREPSSGLSSAVTESLLPQAQKPVEARGATTSNWTGTGACSPAWFDQNGFCPANGPWSFCVHNVVSASLEHPAADGGSATGCSDWGQLLLKYTGPIGSQEFTIDQGSWRNFGYIGPVGGAGFWKFELVQRPDGSTGQFASRVFFN